MRPDPSFANKPKSFWALVRTLGQHLGYTERGEGRIRVHTPQRMRQALVELGLDADIVMQAGSATALGQELERYFAFRAALLNDSVQHFLMDANQAKAEFDRLRRQLRPKCPLPMNNQKGKKKAPAYLTGIVNMLIEAHADGVACDYDPRELTTVTLKGQPLRTLARRVDGAFPSTVNPIAVWEIKEYYYTTTFGSRVADGVYESLLDGMELEELLASEGIKVLHYLFVDAKYTWWECGKSYLCRLVDMLHMGYVDEIIFGREVIDRLPELVAEWVKAHRMCSA
jgi:hypothetical protein